MPTFSYHAKNKTGKVVQGQVTADNQKAAGRQLIGQGLVPVRIEQSRGTAPAKKQTAKKAKPAQDSNQSVLKKQLFAKVKTDELAMFCRQMYSLLKAGVPLYQSLEKVTSTTKNALLKKALKDALEQIKAGNHLSRALKKYPKIFSLVFVNVCRTGEETGNLHQSFAYLANYTTMEAATKKKVFAALRYPTIVLVAVTVAIVVLNIVVVPAFSQIYANFDEKLPLITRILIGFSDFLLEYGVFFIIGLMLLALVITMYFRTPSGEFILDKYKFKVPVFGSILFRLNMARFSRIFATMLKSGITVTVAMDLVGRALDNRYLEKKIFSIRDKLQEGVSVTHAAKASELFTPLTLQMIEVGEETANIDDMLIEVADYYDENVDYDLNRLNQLLEPFLLVLMGGLVLITALGIFLPMWDMVKFVQ